MIVARAKFGIIVDVDFREARSERFQNRSNLRLGFCAQMATGARINRRIARRGKLQPSILGSRESVGRFSTAQPATLDKLQQTILHAGIVSKIGKGAQTRAGQIESSQNVSVHCIHHADICISI